MQQPCRLGRRIGKRLVLLLAGASVLATLIAQPGAAIDIKPRPEQSDVPVGGTSEPRVPDIFDDVTQLERVDADTTRAIVKKFLAENSNPRKYILNVVSLGYEEDEASPALKLNQVWIGANAVLLEITGLARKRNAVSAVMRRDTLRLKNNKGEISQLQSFEGVTELRDRRGGSALVVNPGDTLYLLFDKFDDFYAYSLSHVNRDGKESAYFDRIDPRFRERYDTMHMAATSPAAMKEFLVEFANNDPDKRVLRVFSKLLGEMRAQQSFEGYYAAFRLIGDPKDYDAMRRTASTAEQKAVIESIEEDKRAEIRRREEAKLAEQRRSEARRAAEQQAEQARAAEQRCLVTPSCRQAVEERKAMCVQSVQNCRARCDSVVGAGSQGSFFGNLAAAGMARVCYGACKCDNNFGDLIARFDQATGGRTTTASSPASRESGSSTTSSATVARPTSNAPVNKTFVCTIYCNSSTGPTIRRETSAPNRSHAAKEMGDQADQLCRDSGHSKASSVSLPERQCFQK